MAAVGDHWTCNVIYVDRRVRQERLVQRTDLASSNTAASLGSSYVHVASEHADIAANITALLSAFHQVYLCASGASCRLKASELNEHVNAELVPTLVLVDIPLEDAIGDQVLSNGHPASPNSFHYDFNDSSSSEDRSFYGMQLLQCVASDSQHQNLSKLFIPIAVVSNNRGALSSKTSRSSHSASGVLSLDSDGTGLAPSTIGVSPEMCHLTRYLDFGAEDVVTSPLQKERMAGLAVHAYRAHKEAAKEQKAFLAVKRGRKRSWVGVDDEKPYAYLREAMVSGLMDGICKPQTVGESIQIKRILIRPERRAAVAQAIGKWGFSAHDFSEDELLHAASLMIQHALTLPDLEQWRITADSLTAFLIATRTAYNSFVPYHNFRHVVDVLQAVFYFLLQLGALPAYPPHSPARYPSPIASILRPLDALTLLITAVGHDVGHPGVNNAFLVTLNAPLAQLYNDRSVLESFHCAAFSQILRRYWPASFQSAEMRKLLINSILATDMGLHFDYMKKLGQLQEKVQTNAGTDGWDGKYLEEQRTLLCSLLIKCADISNVARPHDIAAQWAAILTDEFARQASMEDDLGIPTALFAPPIRDSIIEMGKSQIGFMNLFALPLFQGVTVILPAMQFSVDELLANRTTWEVKIEREKERERARMEGAGMLPDGFASLAQSSEALAPATRSSPSAEDSINASRRSSRTLGQIVTGEPPQSRRTSASSPLSTVPSTDMTLRGSSTTFTSAQQPSLRDRRSSNTAPSQLQLGLNSVEDQRQSGDHSLVTVLVTSNGRGSKPSDAQSTNHGTANSSERSEKSSIPSSNEWPSQVTSPVNVTCSPTTQGTSFLSGDESERGEPDARAGLSPGSTSDTEGADTKHDYANGVVAGAPKTIRHRTSRWRLKNFWKSKPKTPVEGSP